MKHRYYLYVWDLKFYLVRDFEQKKTLHNLLWTWHIMLILFLSFYDSCCVLYHENCTPEFHDSVYLIMVFFIVEDEIFQLNVSFILIYSCFFVQVIIYVTFIRNRELVFQIFTFLCLHELYMAYAWSKWSRLKLFPLNKSYI